ncbi:MAG: fumarate hydratase, class [Ilumatobacteraceae bacterium]|nr:fumarate hydratase, class [Ilumatobacteraceae bacterium]
MSNRVERDSIGQIEVPAEHYWGAQTQRSIVHFAIGDDRMPLAVCHALALVKKAAATVNERNGQLPPWKADLIRAAADEIIDGSLDAEFPLFLFQTGSGTHTNMNVNEVISNRAIEMHGGVMGSKDPIHPNDDVNMSQSSNDTFPTAMHVASVHAVAGRLLPALTSLRDAIDAKGRQWNDVTKIGRTHLQDATPLTVGQEWSGYVAQLDDAIAEVRHALIGVHRLAIGGTAVGTGINAPTGFGDQVAAQLAELTGQPFVGAPNRFAAQSAMDDIVRLSASLRGAAVALFKFANDVRWSASGPRAGLDELHLPANEPGSSIMPGKVNPSQAEAMLQVCIQVMANDSAVAMAGAEGNFQLNVFRPVAIGNVLRSIGLLADTCTHCREFLVEGADVNRARLQSNVERSVMRVTALSPVIGYDAAAAIAHLAMEDDLTLREAALRSGVTPEQFDAAIPPL